MIKIGKLVNTHGLMGEVRIQSNSDFKDERFVVNKKLVLRSKRETYEMTIEKYHTHKNFDLIKFVAYDSINDVEKFKGFDVYAQEILQEQLNEDEYLNSELINLEIVDEENNSFGYVTEVIENPAHNLLRIKYNDKLYLIPFIKVFILNVDLEKKQITVKMMDGLIDEN